MEEIFCKEISDLHNWLKVNYKREKGIWLVFLKGKDRTMSWEDIVKELLCFGWIDSKAGSVDSTKSKIWISPRKPSSGWSAINKIHIENLIKEGRMQKAGLEVVEQAKKSGAWNILDSVERLEVPTDLEKKLKSYPNAYKNFTNFPKSTIRATLQWILTAKTPNTRASRILKTAELAEENMRAI